MIRLPGPKSPRNEQRERDASRKPKTVRILAKERMRVDGSVPEFFT